MGLAERMEQGRREHSIREAIKQGRLGVLGEDKAFYIDKQGKRIEGTLLEIAGKIIDVTGQRANLACIGVNEIQFKDTIVKEYTKYQKKHERAK